MGARDHNGDLSGDQAQRGLTTETIGQSNGIILLAAQRVDLLEDVLEISVEDHVFSFRHDGTTSGGFWNAFGGFLRVGNRRERRHSLWI